MVICFFLYIDSETTPNKKITNILNKQRKDTGPMAHFSEKHPRGSSSVHSEYDNSTEDGFKPIRSNEEE